MDEFAPGDRVSARYMPSLGVGVVEMALSPGCVLVAFETADGPYHDSFDSQELQLSKLLPARTA